METDDVSNAVALEPNRFVDALGEACDFQDEVNMLYESNWLTVGEASAILNHQRSLNSR